MPRLHSLRILSATLLALSFALPLTAQEKPSDSLLTVNHYLDFETVSGAQVSPDGGRIIYTRRFVDKQKDSFESSLWIMNADGSENRFLVRGGSPVWSPDGTRIAYLAEGAPGGAQVYVRWMNAEGATSQVTRATYAPADIQWSPDGKSIGFAMYQPKPDSWAIDLPAPPPGATWTAPPRYVNKVHYRADRQGFLEPGFVHLYIVPADGGTPRQLTKGEWNAGSRFDGQPGSVGWDFTPDGKSIVFDGLMEETSDKNYRDSDLNVVDIATGVMRKLTAQRGSWSSPAVSPDGKWIAFAGHASTRDSYKTAELFVMAADGSGMKKISGNLDRDVGDLTWARDNSGVYFTASDRGTNQLFFASAAGVVRPITAGQHMFSLGSIASNGTVVGTRSTAQEPADVVRFPLTNPSQLTRLTSVNADILANKKLGAIEELWITSSGGTKVQGWLIKPPNFDPSKKWPLLMEIHGGPHGMYNVGFSYMYQNFAANGYVVLYTNPRGSTGYGSAFGNAIMKKYPGVDYDDLMASVDTVVGRGYVDQSRMYVGGCSGGGVLSSWIIGHTNRFAGAAVRCPVMNWISFAGTADVPYFTQAWFEKPYWEDPKPWLEQSPLMYVGNVTTPTVIMTGELDLRTPMAQSEEFYMALKQRGVPSALLRFQGEFHGTGSKPSNFMRTQLYMMSWYQQHKREKAAMN
ncbi:MAG: S9 family peptidase [Gemmatimonadetes bacterium]|nr:S9 family peptidase [Gemmatimonadota bacterium]MBK9410800.1 S9 family peptidase [Gemmatimonadota bacterium]MBK9977372.1 S9 family peptidase [Gemmatimonadota bacterium]